MRWLKLAQFGIATCSLSLVAKKIGTGLSRGCVHAIWLDQVHDMTTGPASRR